jgi:hypothetical protein
MTSKRLLPNRAVALLAAAASTFAAVLLLTTLAGAQGGGSDVEHIGNTEDTPKPSCPKDPCQAIGSVTGFQVSAKGEKDLMEVPENGELVAWSTRLSRPKGSQRQFFGKFYKDEKFGTVPTARIAVLKPPKEGNEYTLRAQGPVTELNDDLGTKPLHTLETPIPIREGDIIALTVPTWIPNFAVDLSNRNVWRASREKGACEDSNDIKKGEPHQKVGRERAYACTYRQARILYTANYVPAEAA